MLRRYVEAIVFQIVNENLASEQSARMVAMKAASDNAGKIINDGDCPPDMGPRFAAMIRRRASRLRETAALPGPTQQRDSQAE